jgi:excisionase family DNA binding protein
MPLRLTSLTLYRFLDKLMNSWPTSDNLIDKPFLSPKELKDFLGVSILTIYRLIDSGKLPAFKIGKSLRFHKEDIIIYLKSQRIGQVK